MSNNFIVPKINRPVLHVEMVKDSSFHICEFNRTLHRKPYFKSIVLSKLISQLYGFVDVPYTKPPMVDLDVFILVSPRYIDCNLQLLFLHCGNFLPLIGNVSSLSFNNKVRGLFYPSYLQSSDFRDSSSYFELANECLCYYILNEYNLRMPK